jgi:hypothetical protein
MREPVRHGGDPFHDWERRSAAYLRLCRHADEISSCADIAALDKWVARAVTAQSGAEGLSEA